MVRVSPREPPIGGRMGEGAPVRARKGVGRGREGHGDTSPRAPGAALWRRASTGGENMSLERSGGELRNAWLCAKSIAAKPLSFRYNYCYDNIDAKRIFIIIENYGERVTLGHAKPRQVLGVGEEASGASTNKGQGG